VIIPSVCPSDRAPYMGLLAGSFQQWLNSACWLAQPKANPRSRPTRAADKSLGMSHQKAPELDRLPSLGAAYGRRVTVQHTLDLGRRRVVEHELRGGLVLHPPPPPTPPRHLDDADTTGEQLVRTRPNEQHAGPSTFRAATASVGSPQSPQSTQPASRPSAAHRQRQRLQSGTPLRWAGGRGGGGGRRTTHWRPDSSARRGEPPHARMHAYHIRRVTVCQSGRGVSPPNHHPAAVNGGECGVPPRRALARDAARTTRARLLRIPADSRPAPPPAPSHR
jgi:hypothetical protein